MTPKLKIYINKSPRIGGFRGLEDLDEQVNQNWGI
jgi:hypothetical protein